MFTWVVGGRPLSRARFAPLALALSTALGAAGLPHAGAAVLILSKGNLSPRGRLSMSRHFCLSQLGVATGIYSVEDGVVCNTL